MLASFYGSNQVMYQLLNSFNNANLQDDNGFTALFYAVIGNSTGALNTLLIYGASADLVNQEGIL